MKYMIVSAFPERAFEIAVSNDFNPLKNKADVTEKFTVMNDDLNDVIEKYASKNDFKEIIVYGPLNYTGAIRDRIKQHVNGDIKVRRVKSVYND